jgi:hypothetical protein
MTGPPAAQPDLTAALAALLDQYEALTTAVEALHRRLSDVEQRLLDLQNPPTRQPPP